MRSLTKPARRNRLKAAGFCGILCAKVFQGAVEEKGVEEETTSENPDVFVHAWAARDKAKENEDYVRCISSLLFRRCFLPFLPPRGS